MTNERGETFFVGKGVAEALGYANTQKAIRDHVDDNDKLTERFVLSGQNRNHHHYQRKRSLQHGALLEAAAGEGVQAMGVD